MRNQDITKFITQMRQTDSDAAYDVTDVLVVDADGNEVKVAEFSDHSLARSFVNWGELAIEGSLEFSKAKDNMQPVEDSGNPSNN